MKELLLQYANYNIWANKLMIDAMLKLEEAQVDREIISSFPSLRKTVYHTWSGEFVWVQRLQQVAQPVWLAGTYTGSFAEACQDWQRVSGALAEQVNSYKDELALQQLVPYHDLKGNPHATRVCDMLNHVFNHSTYHRGQLVTMLRQLGVSEIPNTDLIAFVRMK